MAKLKEKKYAVSLRKRGRSIGEIAKQLSVSKSTVSLWCKDIRLPKKHIEQIAKRSAHHATRALLLAAEKRRLKRQDDFLLAEKEAFERVGELTKRDIFLLGLGLYWGEGYKRGSQEFGFTNSDSDMIRFYLNWLHSCFNIPPSRLTFRISINEFHKDRIKEVTDYWTKILDVSAEQFTKPSFIKTANKKMYANKNEHFGTLRVKVQKGTQLRRVVLAAIKQIAGAR